MAALTAAASRVKVTAAVSVSRAAASAAQHLSTTATAADHRPNNPPYCSNTADKELYLSVLTSTSTKREARSYLKRFTPAPAILKYLKESSFTQPGAPTAALPPPPTADLHIGIVKIRDAATIDTPTLRGIGRTLSQLTRLGLYTAVILDEPPPPAPGQLSQWRRHIEAQCDRVLAAIEASGGRARRVDGCTTTTTSPGAPSSLTISTPELLLAPLARGVIPVLPPLSMTTAHMYAAATGDDLLLCLTTLLAAQEGVALDRIILLDPLGGIPSHDRPAGAHVFINLAQEHATITGHLPADSPHARNLHTLRTALEGLPATSSALITTPLLAAAAAAAAAAATTPPSTPSTTATTKTKNPLIHNLLTDKPLTSSSLPVQAHHTGTLTTLLKRGIPLTVHVGTQLSHGSIDLPKLVALVEDSFGKRLDLEHYLNRVDGRVAALVVAGEYEGAAIVTWEYPDSDSDSDVGAVAAHPPSDTATHCDAEAAEAAAVRLASAPLAARPKRVLYLDKFAVLKRSQGTGGVADVVFKGMVEAVRSGRLDAEGIVWRSRRWNPVNKWYFERAKGTYKIPHSGWTMFWTSRDAGADAEGVRRFREYERVCRAIVPSLVDE
ncbi:uncharacterized protein H6S33_006833 [Morchella sextelata]|uniref:uncharacterized protein n=1 Tax=Morchella sextelata TaxID=1174677 RepID=UPI001D037F20|nr:uncharacterized protein H6S33_006833 [Morchella sextelata]KAH0604456.1 hypothetical protein H6S33_006833 [Morchella sextelata]